MSRGDRGSPPRLARALLDWLLGPGDHGTLTGDLDEEFERFTLPGSGRLRAGVWYWRQVLLSAPGIAWRRIVGGAAGPSFFAELRPAARVLARRPGFTAAVTCTLALALGVNTAVFTVFHSVVLRPLPYADADRLVRPIPDELFFMGSHQAVAFEERMTSFEGFAAWGRSLFMFADADDAEEVRGGMVAWDHFDVLGARPILGRGFVREDAETGAAVMLSHGLWTRRFGADPSVVGSRVPVYGQQLEVVGVMGPEHVPIEFDWQAWRPMPIDPDEIANRGLAANARLRPGVSLEQAQAEMRAVIETLTREAGEEVTEADRAAWRLVPLREWLLGDTSQALLVLVGAVAFILLLAAANVASLLMSHVGGRSRELAVRLALGGGRARVARQLVTELGLLAALGALVGFGLGWVGLGWLTAQLPPDMPRVGHVRLTTTVFGFTAVASLLAAALAGLAPLLSGSSVDVAPALSRGGRGSAGGARRLRSWLVGAEAALSVVLLVGAVLMVRSLWALQGADPGFDAHAVVTVRPTPPTDTYAEDPQLVAYYDRVTEELMRLPGVSGVGAIQFLPMTPGGWWSSYRPEGAAVDEGRPAPSTAMRVVRPGYFETMGVPLISGRTLTPLDDREGTEPVVVINESLAAEAFPGGEAVGRGMTLGADGSLAVRVVGVVGDVRQSDLRSATHPEAYVAFSVVAWRRMHLVVRASGDPSSLLAGVADAMRLVDPGVPFTGPRLMSDVVGGTFGATPLVTSLLVILGGVAFALALVGVYGVTAQAAAERRREIGIRLALGAERGEVARRAVARGLVPVVLGLAAGLLVAVSGGAVVEGLTYGVQRSDPWVLLVASAALLAASIVALSVPAVRAGRVDPVETLRRE